MISLPSVPTTLPPTETLEPAVVPASATVPPVSNARISSAESSPDVMVTVRLPPLKSVLSMSASVALPPWSIAVAASPSVYVKLSPSRLAIVGGSLTAATSTLTVMAVMEFTLSLSSASTVKAATFEPFTSESGVQNALFVESITSIVPAAKALAAPDETPIFSVPLDTACTTNPSTVPSASASLP